MFDRPGGPVVFHWLTPASRRTFVFCQFVDAADNDDISLLQTVRDLDVIAFITADRNFMGMYFDYW